MKIDISIEQDGGLLKEILTEGAGDDTAAPGETVSVHYVGKLLDGTVFDSSRERGAPFEFTLGKSEVIKGWDVGVATMKRNELALLTCSPDYAYGAQGSPPKIPADSTLVFEVECLDWKSEDLSTKKDGGIQRRIIQKGEGYINPKEGSTVQVHYVGKFEGNVFEERDVTFPIGEGSEHGIVNGIETALESFKKGEISLIKLSPQYAYGSAGKAEFKIPENASLEYTITLKTFEKVKEAWEMNSDEKLEQSEIAKNKGTEQFKDGKYVLAIKQYKRVVSLLDEDPGTEESNKERHDSLLLAGHLNLAACYLKTNEHLEALKSCDKATQIQPENVKGLFRRGQAKAALKDYDQAIEDFKLVVKVDPENKAAKNQIIVCQHQIKAEIEKEKQTYKNMFAKFAEIDKKKEALKGLNSTESGVWQNGQKPENVGNEKPLNLGTSELDNVEILSNNAMMA